MTKDEAQLFKSRWQLVNERIAEETRNSSAATKFHQLAVLFAGGRSLAWTEKMREGETEVRQRWQLLYERWNGKTEPIG